MTTDTQQSLKDDLAFLRGLAGDDRLALAYSGLTLALVGATFGTVTFIYWLIFAGFAGLAHAAFWLWAAGLAVMLVTGQLITRRLPKSPATAGGRGMAGALTGAYGGLTVAGLALLVGGVRIHQPALVLWVFPILLFTLYGAAWIVAYAVKRRAAFAVVALGCFAAAFAEGWTMSRPESWLVLSAGLFALVLAPGVAIMRQARPEPTPGVQGADR